MAGFYEPEILSRVQQMELEILKDVMDLCDSPVSYTHLTLPTIRLV